MDRPRGTPILDLVRDTPRHFTITFRDPVTAAAKPGQFVMLWVPGVDEVPMAVGEIPTPGVASIVVDEIGNGTRALAQMKPGDIIGVRGPYGTRFPPLRGRVLLVGGGIGVPPLVLAAQEAKRARSDCTIDFVIGGRSAELLAGLASLERWSDRVHVTTDDGTRGAKGYATAAAERLVEQHRFDQVLTCGPEVMMKKVVDLANARGVSAWASLERYMKCGIGICDACTMGAGLRLCRDGPVLDAATLARCPEFGKEARAPDGSRVPLHAARVAHGS